MTDNKIAFVIHGLTMGGAEKFLINIVNNLYDAGFCPIVILLSNDHLLINEINKNIEVYTVLRKFKFDLSVSFRVKKLIEHQNIKKIFCVNAYSFFLTKLAYLFDSDSRFYLSEHTTVPLNRKRYFLSLIYYSLVSKKDMFIYISSNQRKFLRRKYFISTTNDKIIYNGIDVTFFNPELFDNSIKESLRSDLNLKNEDKVIVNVARICPEKGHFDAIDALKILHNQYNNKAHLLFVGGGDYNYLESIKRYVDEKKMEGFVHFTGNQADVRRYYYIADVFALTSFAIETFSLSALEAMAFGLPCSLTDVGGASEMILDGKTGTLCQPKNASSIAASWNNLLSRNLKGENIRQFVVDKFSSKRMFHDYVDLLAKS
jgi:glycosyltransferase involved in cell wall biosynthesis